MKSQWIVVLMNKFLLAAICIIFFPLLVFGAYIRLFWALWSNVRSVKDILLNFLTWWMLPYYALADAIQTIRDALIDGDSGRHIEEAVEKRDLF